MADRFDEMARAFCMEHNLAVDDALAALLRKVHDEAIEQGADEMLDFLQAEYVLTKDPLSPDAQHLARKVSKYTAKMRELLATRKVVEAARHAYDCLARHCAVGTPIERIGAMAMMLGDALADYDKAVGG